MEAYCVKCKSKRSMKDEKKVTMKNGKPATQGICTVCGTKMFKIGKWSFLPSLYAFFTFLYSRIILHIRHNTWLCLIRLIDNGPNLIKRCENLVTVNEHPDICENEAFSLLGSNGTGKTTIFHILATLLKPISGIAFVNRYRIIKEQAKIRANIGMYFRLQAWWYAPEYENLKLHSLQYGVTLEKIG